jgi:hypothetical protein
VLLPSEIETRWVIPAARSIIARELVRNYGFTQEDVAETLGITQASVSNYMSGNRADDHIVKRLQEDQNVRKLVREITLNLSRTSSFTPYCMSKYIELFNYVRRSLLICSIHRGIGDEIEDSLCKMCERFLLTTEVCIR